MKIVGITVPQKPFDFGIYSSLGTMNDNVEYTETLYSALKEVLTYGEINLCYVSNNYFESFLDPLELSTPIVCFNKDGSIRADDSAGSFHKLSTNHEPIQYKSGYTTVGKNQVLLPEHYIHTLLPKNSSELTVAEYLDNNTIIASFGEYPSIDCEVVGITDGGIILSDETYEEFLKEFIGYSYVFTNLLGDESKDRELVKYCETLQSNNVRYTLQNQFTPIFKSFGSLINTLSKIFMYVAIGFAAFSALMLMNYISTSISYKKREIGVLRAVGARGLDVFKIFLFEALIICLISSILAIAVTGVACMLINIAVRDSAGIFVQLLDFGIIQVLLIFAIGLAVAFISSFLPTNKIARKKPIDAINNR